ncbi:MAG TPA: hypothetical protein VIM21_03415 [Gemmatimonadaceae bacterium]|jgi:hypothetical protein
MSSSTVFAANAGLNESPNFPLRVVDGLTLPPEYRKALRPGEEWKDSAGRLRQLPRYFYEVPSWDSAMKIELASNFLLWEFIQVDVREAPPLRTFPRYVPCAITLLAVCLDRFREAVGTLVHISANGGYRSPSHRFSKNATPHAWGTAANIYRIGDTYLDTRSAIERFSLIARETLPGIWTRPYGAPTGYAEDHLHLDLGYVLSVPRDVKS